MTILECPNNDDGEIDIIDSDGSPEDGEMTFQCVCMECGCRFEIVCDISIKRINVIDRNEKESNNNI
jgi:transcriptional regulator NrdR family protein